jgi:hypothetical protein
VNFDNSVLVLKFFLILRISLFFSVSVVAKSHVV